MTDPQSLPTAYTYDVLNRLHTLAFNGQTPVFQFDYDALSRRTTLSRPNGVTTTYAYDPASSLTSVLHKLGTTTLDGGLAHLCATTTEGCPIFRGFRKMGTADLDAARLFPRHATPEFLDGWRAAPC